MTDFEPLPVLQDLTDRERELIDATRRGDVLVCSEPAHEIRAQVLRELLLGRRGPLDPRGVRVHQARIVGRLNLDNATAGVGLLLVECVVADGVTARNARLPWLSITRSSVGGLEFNRIAVDENVNLYQARIKRNLKRGLIQLVGAKIGGELILAGAELENEIGPALYGDRVQVERNLNLRVAQVRVSSEDGAIRLSGAHIGGQLGLTDVKVRNETGSALHADGIKIDNVLHLGNARIEGAGEQGAIRLIGARVGGQLGLTGTEIVNESGPALNADSLQVAYSLNLNEVRVTGAGDLGAVRLAGASIAGSANLTAAEIGNQSGPALVLLGAEVASTLYFPAAVVCATPELGHRCPGNQGIDIDRFTFSGLRGIGWQDWLHLIQCHTSSYRPGPYQQLASIERAAGHDGNARRILIAQQQDLYQRAPKALGNWLTRRFHWLWGRLAGYGYLARRTAFALLLALFVAGGLGLWAGHVADGGHRVAERTSSFAAAEGRACTTVELIGLGLDRGLPLSPTGVRTRCDINPDTSSASLFTIAIWLVQAAIWGLATLALAGYTGLIRKAS